MPKSLVQETIPCSAAEAFEIVHDYKKRLEWDTLLREAYIEDGEEAAGKGVITVCTAIRLLGGMRMRTVYVSFNPAQVAAVRLLEPSSFFETFAASIRHIDKPDGRSDLLYEFNFTARPGYLRPLLHPVMLFLLKLETRKRLHALARYVAVRNRNL